jgi:DNA polymerase III subunit delta
MSADAQKALRAAIRESAFASSYYLHGEDDYMKEVASRDLVNAAADPATRDFNVDVLRASELDADSLSSVLGTPPMMAERRVIVIRDAHSLKKGARAALDRYLARPAGDVLLILVTPAGVKVDKGLAGESVPIEFEPLSGARIPKWIVYYVENELKATITGEATILLQEAVGIDVAQLRIELDKLASFSGGGVIDATAVSSVVGIRSNETLGGFLDAVGRRDAAGALSLVSGILLQPKTSAVTVVMALTTHVFGIGWALAARGRGVPPSRLEGELFGLLKDSGSLYTGRSWSEAVRSWSRATEYWSSTTIDAALVALLETDVILKGTRLSTEEQVLSNLVLHLTGTAAPRRAA